MYCSGVVVKKINGVRSKFEIEILIIEYFKLVVMLYCIGYNRIYNVESVAN